MTIKAQPALASMGARALTARYLGTSGKWDLGGDLAKKAMAKQDFSEEVIANHSWRQQNHIWTADEVENIDQSKHVPVTASDHVVQIFMRGLYHGFNWITGYKADDPSVNSVAWRLIILESFAGVPGFVAAGFRHFYSLRTLQRDHGSIYTFLEEAENERFHLLTCLKVFEASFVTRWLVVAAQLTMGPLLTLTYFVKPSAMHRFVGYLEETAVDTYSNLIQKAETPGTKLHAAWQDMPAPAIAKTYWKLGDDATWIETLKHICADEAHHRDVNHTFATLPRDAQNPFIKDHMADFDRAALDRIQSALLADKSNNNNNDRHGSLPPLAG